MFSKSLIFLQEFYNSIDTSLEEFVFLITVYLLDDKHNSRMEKENYF